MQSKIRVQLKLEIVEILFFSTLALPRHRHDWVTLRTINIINSMTWNKKRKFCCLPKLFLVPLIFLFFWVAWINHGIWKGQKQNQDSLVVLQKNILKASFSLIFFLQIMSRVERWCSTYFQKFILFKNEVSLSQPYINFRKS